jgi:tetratricopeptide (TPR) repeat protein
METDALKQEIDALIAALGEETSHARPAEERAVVERIRLILERTRAERTGSARDIWEKYLPYAAKFCLRLTRLEPGWEEELEFFASENGQYWLDSAAASLDQGEIRAAAGALGQLLEGTRMMKQDPIARVELLLQALDIAVEITDKKHAISLYEEAEKVYRKHLTGGERYTGTGWLRKIKKMGDQLKHFQVRLRRYFKYSETVIVTLGAEMEGDLERVIETLQVALPGRVKVTRKIKETGAQDGSEAGRFQARVKISLE